MVNDFDEVPELTMFEDEERTAIQEEAAPVEIQIPISAPVVVEQTETPPTKENTKVKKAKKSTKAEKPVKPVKAAKPAKVAKAKKEKGAGPGRVSAFLGTKLFKVDDCKIKVRAESRRGLVYASIKNGMKFESFVENAGKKATQYKADLAKLVVNGNVEAK